MKYSIKRNIIILFLIFCAATFWWNNSFKTDTLVFQCFLTALHDEGGAFHTDKGLMFCYVGSPRAAIAFLVPNIKIYLGWGQGTVRVNQDHINPLLRPCFCTKTSKMVHACVFLHEDQRFEECNLQCPVKNGFMLSSKLAACLFLFSGDCLISLLPNTFLEVQTFIPTTLITYSATIQEALSQWMMDITEFLGIPKSLFSCGLVFFSYEANISCLRFCNNTPMVLQRGMAPMP